MSRSQANPMGVTGDQDRSERSPSERNASSPPGRADRWLASQLAGRFDPSRLRIALWDSPAREGRADMPVMVRFEDRGALYKLLANPGANFGDLYSAGRITVHGDLMVVMDEALSETRTNPRLAAVLAYLRAQTPTLADSRDNIHHHYDLGNEFYKLWLDSEALQYTCAYYADEAMSLEQAQVAKMHHVCRKLRLQPGERVVEAGGGWGGFAIFMAREYGVRVRSFNISKEQIAWSREWSRQQGQDSLVEFVEDDFRNISGTYDVFVSIGMLEHVGVGNYRKLGTLIDRVLTPEGRGLVHTIGRDRRQPLNPWIARRIFPGAYPPTLREMMEIFEPSGLSVLDVENIRLHYARTLEHWLERYEDNLDAVRSMFDENFVRAWRLYLTGSSKAFVHGSLQLFQVLFSRSGMNRIPRTREHVYLPVD
ncbi:MAG: cyclopropane-fatty-acyl-phospholipid synthase family protein [Lysobacterales bacterium]